MRKKESATIEVGGTIERYFPRFAIWAVLGAVLLTIEGGCALASDQSRTFAQVRGRDKIPPTVTATSPANGTTGVPIGSTVTATFSEAVKNVTTTTFRLSAGATPVPGTVTLNEATATFIPSAPLAYSMTYTATVTTGVTDLRGNPLPNNYNWTFTTTPSPNTAPVANAGPDQTVTTGSPVTLDGSASSDANGDSLTYVWSFSSKPAGSTAALSSATVVRPTFTADLAGVYVLSLVVSDGSLSSLADTVTITATIVAGKCIFLQDHYAPPGSGIGLLPDGRIVIVGSDWIIEWGQVYAFNPDTSGGQSIASFQGVGAGIAVQPDGKFVVVGTRQENVLLLRYDSYGVLDGTFGTEGAVTYNAGVQEKGYSVALQADDKIVVAGFSYNYVDGDLLLLRYNSDGTLDGSFGADGVVIYDTGRSEYGGQDVALQPDGKILVTGTAVGQSGTQDVLLLRYNPDGTLDGVFGVNGVVTYDGGDWDDGRGIAVQRDGRIVVTGARGTGNQGVVLLLRYNADGTPDATFGNAGVATFGPGRGYKVAEQPDGKIVVAGETIQAGTLFNVALAARYNSDGTPDLSFGSGGVVAYDGGDGHDAAADLALAKDGAILAVGVSNDVWTAYGGSAGNLLVMRLLGSCQP